LIQTNRSKGLSTSTSIQEFVNEIDEYLIFSKKRAQLQLEVLYGILQNKVFFWGEKMVIESFDYLL